MVMLSSCGQYSWNQRTPSLLACATSSMLLLEAVLRIYGTPISRAISATPVSLSG